MDNLEKASVNAGIIGAIIMCLGVAVLAYGWLAQREQFTWFYYLYLAINVAAMVVAGILSGVFSIAHIKRDRDLVMPGFIAGVITEAIPVAVVFIIIALYSGSETGWVVLALKMLFLLIVMVAVSALMSAAYVVIRRMWKSPGK
ncbi:MAG TPA: hypothetical protein VMC84_04100 [Methanocella sp.]|uniref:hypothetical protein n=1 Tax=Methanocella sp. TaxID=2052833 RepID=UPI002C1D6C2B|nr:hypothetical protein [Methanocella sp.]HTY90337.1 hypothetical protein [Methanocella sp.]